MVSMNLLRADPLLHIGQLSDIVRDEILPSLDALKDLQSQGKVLAGGHPVGQRYVVLFGGRVGGRSARVVGEVAPFGAGGDACDRVEELRRTAGSRQESQKRPRTLTAEDFSPC